MSTKDRRGSGRIKPREGEKRTKEEEELEQKKKGIFFPGSRSKSGWRRREGDLKGGFAQFAGGACSTLRPPSHLDIVLFI